MHQQLNKMDSKSNLEERIQKLQARLKAENLAKHSDVIINDPTLNAICSPRHTSTGRRPKLLGDLGTPTRTRKQLNLPVSVLTQPKSQDFSEVDRKMKEIMKMNGLLTLNGKKYQTDIKDLEQIGELGSGTCGHVVKMLHKPSNTIIAVKQMRRSGNSDENKRIIMDLDVVFKSMECPYIVRYLGCFMTEADVWICMELMATCFDRLLKRLNTSIPENVLGKVALATVKALHYLKESHGIIHRDVKPSNILLDEKGNVKLCDFGISGRLVDSKARTKNAGCAAYMAPERIEPPDPGKPDYDIRADVWSLGITLVELATGMFPYKDCKCDFEVLSRVLHEDPPSLPNDGRFTVEFRDFVSRCLMKDYSHRPKYKKLLEHPFLKRYEYKPVDVAEWYSSVTSSITPSLSQPLRSDYVTSPVLPRRLPRDVPSPSYSHDPDEDRNNPLVLQRFQHQQNLHLNRSSSLSPSRRYMTDHYKCGEELSPILSPSATHQDAIRSNLPFKFHLSSSPATSRSPSPAPPSPPPRINRYCSLDSGSKSLSPFMQRRNFFEEQMAAVASSSHRIYDTNSPLPMRRYGAGCPPTPPPRRLSETSSVPGSPQLYNYGRSSIRRRSPSLAGPSHYTPQPQHRVYTVQDS